MADLSEIVKIEYKKRMDGFQRELTRIIGVPDPTGKTDDRNGGTLKRELFDEIEKQLEDWQRKLEASNSNHAKTYQMTLDKIEGVHEQWKFFDGMYRTLQQKFTDFECLSILEKKEFRSVIDENNLNFQHKVMENKKQIDKFYDAMDNFKAHVGKKLEILVEFRQSIADNKFQIDSNQHKIGQIKNTVQAFKDEDVFKRADKNYGLVMGEFMKMAQLIEDKIRPEIRLVQDNQLGYVKNEVYTKFQE